MPLPTYQILENILGEMRFVVPTQLADFFQYPPLDNQPIPEPSKLRQLREGGFLLFPGPPEPWSIIDMLRICPEFFRQCPEMHPAGFWYEGIKYPQKFALRNLPPTKWYALRSSPAEGSIDLEWERQQLIPKSEIAESVPDAVLVVWAMLLFSKVYGQQLFNTIWVRTSAQISIFSSPKESIHTLGPQVYVGTDEGKIVLGFHRQKQMAPNHKKKPGIGVAITMSLET